MDRNHAKTGKGQSSGASLSARRAWIEIKLLFGSAHPGCVALRKESVDRNDFLDLPNV